MKVWRIWRQLPPLVDEQTRQLNAEIHETLEREGLPPSERTARECFLFVLWSVHVSLSNMRPGVTRRLLLALHGWKIRRLAGGRDEALLHLYERRRIEALYVIRNIHITRHGDGFAPPLTRRLARMFLRNAAGEAHQAPGGLVEEVQAILSRHTAACAGALLSPRPA